ncbi:MAG TPA: thioredoxin [Clostridia bacterium]|nr:thioredoxin [Clostridia bacterium]
MKLKLFYLPGCPHCQLALKCIDQLRAENSRYSDIEIEMIDEGRHRALANTYDYWLVPCFYLDQDKLHEGHAEKEDVRRVFDKAIAGAQEKERPAI